MNKLWTFGDSFTVVAQTIHNLNLTEIMLNILNENDIPESWDNGL